MLVYFLERINQISFGFLLRRFRLLLLITKKSGCSRVSEILTSFTEKIRTLIIRGLFWFVEYITGFFKILWLIFKQTSFRNFWFFIEQSLLWFFFFILLFLVKKRNFFFLRCKNLFFVNDWRLFYFILVFNFFLFFFAQRIAFFQLLY